MSAETMFECDVISHSFEEIAHFRRAIEKSIIISAGQIDFLIVTVLFCIFPNQKIYGEVALFCLFQISKYRGQKGFI